MLHGKELNIFWLLDSIYTGMSVTVDETLGVAALKSEEKKFYEDIPLTFVAPYNGLLSKDAAVEFAVACCRMDVAGFCYCWTRHADAVFKDVVEIMGTAFGMWPWRLAQAWRFERADVHEHVAYFMLCFTAAVPDLYRQTAIADALFFDPWNVDSNQAATIGTIASKLQIYVVPCSEINARIVVSGYPYYITQRDWSVLGLVLIFTTHGDGIEAIEVARRSMRLSKKAV